MKTAPDKIIYIVRHGETEGNALNAVQDGTDMLSNAGKGQAERIAARMKGVDFDAMIASDYIRARETADAIFEATGIPYTQSAHLREVMHPTALVGVPRSDERFVVYHKEQLAHIADEAWHYDDEENFFDLRARARSAEAELLAHPATTLLVVSHANFIKALVGQFIFQDAFTPDIFLHIRPSFLMSNTGLTLLERRADRWHLITWNDHSHLAD